MTEWTEWKPHKPGDPCPIEDGTAFEVRIWDCEEADSWETDASIRNLWWGRGANPIIAFRTKKGQET
ncbi:MAG: hypothetical protein GY807_24055 [Gammaproteobacteria bacterium]|nr:hypothetical protein [Gammaproteobacteria bacterium]